MVKLQIFNCENSIIKSYLFRCRNSTFFAGVSCDQTKKKVILFSIIKSLTRVEKYKVTLQLDSTNL